MPLDPTVFIHPNALVETDHIGPRTRVWAFAHVMAGARIGSDCNIGDHAFIEGGAKLGDRVTVKNAVLVWDKVTVEDEVFLGPNMVFTNDLNPRVAFKKAPGEMVPTLVKRGASLGANCTIVCGVTIGQHAFVGAGAVVLHDIPPYAMMAGNPARRIGWICICGQKLPGTYHCGCGRRYGISAKGEALAPL